MWQSHLNRSFCVSIPFRKKIYISKFICVFLHMSIVFLRVMSGILMPLLHIFIFSCCKLWRQQFWVNKPLGYSKWNFNCVQDFATTLLACMTSHFFSVTPFPSPWNGNDIWSHWLSTLISMIKGSVEKLGFIISVYKIYSIRKCLAVHEKSNGHEKRSDML